MKTSFDKKVKKEINLPKEETLKYPTSLNFNKPNNLIDEFESQINDIKGQSNYKSLGLKVWTDVYKAILLNKTGKNTLSEMNLRIKLITDKHFKNTKINLSSKAYCKSILNNFNKYKNNDKFNLTEGIKKEIGSVLNTEEYSKKPKKVLKPEKEFSVTKDTKVSTKELLSFVETGKSSEKGSPSPVTNIKKTSSYVNVVRRISAKPSYFKQKDFKNFYGTFSDRYFPQVFDFDSVTSKSYLNDHQKTLLNNHDFLRSIHAEGEYSLKDIENLTIDIKAYEIEFNKHISDLRAPQCKIFINL